MTIPDDAWPALREIIGARFAGVPWPTEYVNLDLSWHDAAGVPLPGRPTLIARWGWTDHRVKALIASRPPAHHQPTASQSPVSERANLGNHPKTASAPPADRQRTASRPPAAANSESDRQPTASGGTLQPAFSGPNRQPVASEPAPDHIGSPSLSLSAFQGDRDQIGSRAPDPALFAPPPVPTTEAGARFSALLAYWSGPTIREELRFEIDPVNDARWFEALAATPAYAELDLVVVLDGWDDFLRRSYTSRLKNPGKPFVSDWRTSVKASLRRAIGKPPATPATEEPHHAPPSPQRGSFGRTRQSFADIPVHNGHDKAEEAMEFWRSTTGE